MVADSAILKAGRLQPVRQRSPRHYIHLGPALSYPGTNTGVKALFAGRVDVDATDDLITIEDGVSEPCAVPEVGGVSKAI